MAKREYPGTPLLNVGDRVVWRSQPTNGLAFDSHQNAGRTAVVTRVYPSDDDPTNYTIAFKWEDPYADLEDSAHAAWFDLAVSFDSLIDVEEFLNG